MDLAQIQSRFAENFTLFGELGASVSIWQNGQPILDLAGGYRDRALTLPWSVSTPVLFWSATKGLAAATLLHACQENQISLDRRVSEFWPEFSAAGKSAITIAQLLSHQAGLPALSKEVPVTAYEEVIAALAEEAPHWNLGDGHGYHPRTFGFLLDELVRRISGRSLAQYFQVEFAGPLQLELWIGLDPAREPDVASVFPAKTAPAKGDLFYTAFLTAGSLTARSFLSPRGLNSVASLNTPEARAASFPAFGGIGTARGLAKFYALLAEGGIFEGRTYFTPSTLTQMTTTLSQGPDRILQLETAFSAGFMRDPVDQAGRKLRQSFGPSLLAFGHPGAGGSTGFADPEHHLAFAYVMNQMEPGVLPNQKALRLIDALYSTHQSADAAVF